MKSISKLAQAAIVAVLAVLLTSVRVPKAHAQDAAAGSEMGGPPPLPDASSSVNGELPPLPKISIRQPITGSMLVAPPYGDAPLKVGFFVLANDPENIGFLTYQWNFGDGTVSSLPPELYIFHTYANPGNYVCTLIVKTVDGREKTFFQGVIVKASVTG